VNSNRGQPEVFKDDQCTYFFDGKWRRPVDLVVCPRMYDKLVGPLTTYWKDQHDGAEEALTELVKNVGCFSSES
jgi:hypothetical protein